MFSTNKNPVVYFRLSFLFSSLFIGNFAIAEVDDKNKKSKELAKTSTVVVIGHQQDDSLNLNTPTTSGSRLDLSALQTPASVNSLSGDDIRGRNNASIQEAVARSPGIFRFGSPGNGGTTLAARGFVGHGSVMQLYDGTRTYIGAGTLTFPTDTWTVDRIDVLRGPASVLYGEGATGAAVNVIPKNPFNGDINTALRISAGSWHKRQAALDSGGSLTDSLSFRLATKYQASDGWKERTETEGTAFRGALAWQANSSLRFTLSQDISVQHPLNDFGTPLVDGRYTKNLRKKNYNVVDDDLFYNDRTSSLKTQWKINDAISTENQLYYITSSRVWVGAEGYTWQPKERQLEIAQFYHIAHSYEHIGDRQIFTAKHSLFGLESQTLAGIEFNHIRFKNTSNLGENIKPKRRIDIQNSSPIHFVSGNPFSGSYKTKTNIFASFTENRLQFTDQFSLVTGLRLDHVDMDRDNLRDGTKSGKTLDGFNWRTGLVYAPSNTLSLYGQYSTSTDGVGHMISLSPEQQNFDLSTARQAEIGIKQMFWEQKGEWTLAMYHIAKKKLLTRDPVNPNNSIQIGKQSSRGIEASFNLDLPIDMNLSANAAYVKAKYDDFNQIVKNKLISQQGNKPVNVPSYTANLWLTQNIHQVVNLGAGVRYVGSRYGDASNENKIPHYTVVDANAHWNIVPNLKLGLEVNNLFDQHYAITSHNSGKQWLIGEPRSFLLTLDYKF